MAYVDIFEPTSAAKQLENATGETVTGAAPMGTTDQNAAKIAANQTPGVWTSAPAGSGVDGNGAIIVNNMKPGVFVGEVSSDALNGVKVPMPPNQVILTHGALVPVFSAADVVLVGSPGTATIAGGTLTKVKLSS